MSWMGRLTGLVLVLQGTGIAPASTQDSEQAILEMVQSRDRTIQEIVRSDTGGETAEERDRLRAIVGEMFDFDAYSRLCLGRYWAERSEVEKKAFVDLNRKLVERNYSDPALYTKAEKIDYSGVEIDGSDAVVKTQVHYKSEMSTIDYLLHKVDGRWLIFDMVIDDLSVGKSNRSQFRKEIRKTSFDGLMAKLRKKLEEADGSGKGGT